MSNEEQADTHDASFLSVWERNALATGNSQMKRHAKQCVFHCYCNSISMRSFTEVKKNRMDNGLQQSKFSGCLFVLFWDFFESMWTLSSQKLSMNNCPHIAASWNVLVPHLYENRYYILYINIYISRDFFPYIQLIEKE